MHCQEYGAQTVLASIQTVIVIGGTLTTAALLKAAGYPDARPLWSTLPVFIRDWGFVLLLVPAIWVICTVALERSLVDSSTKRTTIASGVVVILALLYVLIGSAVSTMGGTILSTTNGEEGRQSSVVKD